MEYRQVGKSGLRISEVGLGSWLTIGYDLNEVQTNSLIVRAIELGINFFDTADAYENGKSEKIIGNVLTDATIERKKLVIASKVFYPMSEEINDRGLSRKHIMESIEGTLDRLQTDYLDIYYCHRFDYYTPLSETVSTMDDLISQGLIHYWGTSCWLSYQLERAQWVAKELYCQPPIVEQPMYNMLDRDPELHEFSVCKDHGIGITVFSPLAEGFLTGKYLESIPLDSRAMMTTRKKILRTNSEVEKLRQLKTLADEYELKLSQLALAWILSKEEISSVITGATKTEHIEQNVQASGVKLTKNQLESIEKILDNEPTYRYKYIPEMKIGRDSKLSRVI